MGIPLPRPDFQSFFLPLLLLASDENIQIHLQFEQSNHFVKKPLLGKVD
jgi:capsule polysaccharide modification protein KpsS